MMEQKYFKLQNELENLALSFGMTAKEFKNQIGSFPQDTILSALNLMKEQLSCVEGILERDQYHIGNITFLADYQYSRP